MEYVCVWNPGVTFSKCRTCNNALGPSQKNFYCPQKSQKIAV